jgi:general secretion pathway protein B
MSYILEALKKVEQKKEREERPKSVTFSGNDIAATKKRMAWWPYLLIAVLVVNAFFLLRWGSSPPPPEKPGRLAPAVSPGPTAVPVQSAPPTDQARTERKAAPARRIVKSGPTRSDSQKEPARTADVGKTQYSPVSEKNALATAAPPAKPERPVEKPASVPGRIFALSELPDEIRSSLPEFRISGHAYSPEPQTRVVRINEKILQEGQDLSPGLRVEQIVPTGVILSYRGYRFLVGISQPRS